VFGSIVDGCRYLLENGILHRDLKPANILFKDKAKHPVIADFGFAAHISDSELMNKNVGSPLYMAPETLSDLKFSEKSEVFSLGILLYEMLSGKTPWSAVSERDLLAKIKTVKPSKISNLSQSTW
jgi:serine/threonine protein kinase